MFSLIPWRRERTRTGALLPREESPFRLMRRDLETLFNRFFPALPVMEELLEEIPVGVEMEEEEKEIVARFEVPGFEPEEIELLLTENVLTVHARHEEKEGEEKEKAPARYAETKRSVLLPPGVDLEKIEAVYHNGILEVRLPKTPAAVGKKIEVKTK